jgi:hypothetical protein
MQTPKVDKAMKYLGVLLTWTTQMLLLAAAGRNNVAQVCWRVADPAQSQ